MIPILKKLAKILSLSILLFYAVAIVGMALYQDNLLYEPKIEKPDAVRAGLPALNELMLTAEDGQTLLTWHFVGEANKPAILYFQGNAGNLESQARIVKPLMQAGYSVIMVEYRGYGGNDGTPSEMGLFADARAGITYAKSLGFEEGNLILYGRSLGTAVVTKMATEIDAKGVILQAPFTSITDAAADHYPYLPVRYLVKDPYDSLSRIKAVSEPLFVFHGDTDRTVNPALTTKLFEAANEPKELIVFPGGRHSNIFLSGGNDAVLNWLSDLN